MDNFWHGGRLFDSEIRSFALAAPATLLQSTPVLVNVQSVVGYGAKQVGRRQRVDNSMYGVNQPQLWFG